MKVLVVLPAARDQYPAEAEQRRADAVMAYSTPEVEITVGFPSEAWVRTGTPYSRLCYLEPR